jgi:hypothetical protein
MLIFGYQKIQLMRLMRENNMMERDEILSKVLKSGRRTYFFDVRSTKSNDYYITVTESKKFTEADGSFHFKKHKIYIYKEDFEMFKGLLDEMMTFVIDHKGNEVISERHNKDFKRNDSSTHSSLENFTDIRFEDI